MVQKRLLSLLMIVSLIMSVFAVPAVSAAQADREQIGVATDVLEVSANYGLAKNIQDGNILHCFNWKYNDIKAELKNIAEAGFTSVQTSPAQPAGSGAWYWLYQPYGFYVGTNSLGSKSDLQSLCQEADKYGIKVVVDVVANHLNGDTNRVQDDLKDNQYWHTMGGVSSWEDRYQVTHGEIGMRDLNSEHSYVQKVVANYVNELKGIGVDGIRWDAAKHIALPSEGCNFWPAVTSQGLYHYGEILVGPDDRGSGNEGLMIEYTKYMTVTDSSYGMTLRNSFAGGSVPSSYGNWATRGVAADKLIYWGESHDTWSNNQDWGFSNGMSQNVIDRAYAAAASRSGTNALYFSRPESANKDSIHSGQKGSTAFKNQEIAAVNQLKNACVGEKDYYTTGNNCAVVCRESGAVIVAGSGGDFNVNVPNGGGTTKPGTYKDLVSGSTWTVTSSNISGQIGSSGIAVLLNAKPAGPSVSVTPGSQSYKTDSLTLTLNYSDATSGQYSIDGGAYKSFTNGQKITIGAGEAYGTKTTVSVKASSGSSTSDVQTYTYTKADPNATGIYFDNSSANWSEVYCYIYKDGSNAPKEWPGTKMTKESGNIWFYEPPKGYENCFVLFTDNKGNQIPGANEAGLEYNGSPKIYQSNSWKDYAPVYPTVPSTTAKPTETQAPDPTETQKPTAPGPVEMLVLLGDADSNGIINIKDATFVQKFVAGLVFMSHKEIVASDVDMDSDITIKDATLLQKYVAEMITSDVIGTMVKFINGNVEPQPTVPTDPTEAPATQATKPATQPSTQSPTQSATTKPESKENTVYFKNSNGWGSVFAYVWSTAGGELKAWPGTAMTYVTGDVYRITLDKKYDMIIFSDNGSNKTGDLSIPGNGYIYNGSWSAYNTGSGGNNNNNNNTSGNVTIRFVDTNGWGSVKLICWQNGSSNQQEFTMQSAGNNTYSVSVSSSYDKLYFSNGNQWTQHFDFPKNGGTYTCNQGWN